MKCNFKKGDLVVRGSTQKIYRIVVAVYKEEYLLRVFKQPSRPDFTLFRHYVDSLYKKVVNLDSKLARLFYL